MSDIALATIISSLITVGGMFAAIVFNEFSARRREKRKRAQTFFNNFFPERLNAHKEAIRVITECGIDELDPEPKTLVEVKKVLQEAGERVEMVCLGQRLFMDEAVYSALGEFSVALRTAEGKLDEPIQPVDQFIDRVAVLQDQYYELVKLLREKSGVHIINKEFAESLESLKNLPGKDGDKPEKEKQCPSESPQSYEGKRCHKPGSFPAKSGL